VVWRPLIHTVTTLKPSSSAMERNRLVLPDPLAPFIKTEICIAFVRVALTRQDDKKSRSLVEAVELNAGGA